MGDGVTEYCEDGPRASVCYKGTNALYPPHPRPLRLWTAGAGVPLRFVDNDPRLDKPGQGDTTAGQDNWDVAFEFAKLSDLASSIDGGFSLPSHSCGNWVFNCGPIEDNQIVKLAIMAHGGPGVVDIDNKIGKDVDSGGNFLTDPGILNVSSIPARKADLDKILKKLGWRATVYLMCCMAADADAGRDLLKALSKAWEKKEIKVVGFRTILYAAGPGQVKKGSQGSSCYAGCRETHYSNGKTGTTPRPYEGTQWASLTELPWASESTPHARMAQKGALLQNAQSGLSDGSCVGVCHTVPAGEASF